jgi:hypothetical protein
VGVVGGLVADGDGATAVAYVAAGIVVVSGEADAEVGSFSVLVFSSVGVDIEGMEVTAMTLPGARSAARLHAESTTIRSGIASRRAALKRLKWKCKLPVE